jgi:hypothetical protein
LPATIHAANLFGHWVSLTYGRYVVGLAWTSHTLGGLVPIWDNVYILLSAYYWVFWRLHLRMLLHTQPLGSRMATRRMAHCMDRHVRSQDGRVAPCAMQGPSGVSLPLVFGAILRQPRHKDGRIPSMVRCLDHARGRFPKTLIRSSGWTIAEHHIAL